MGNLCTSGAANVVPSHIKNPSSTTEERSVSNPHQAAQTTTNISNISITPNNKPAVSAVHQSMRAPTCIVAIDKTLLHYDELTAGICDDFLAYAEQDLYEIRGENDAQLSDLSVSDTLSLDPLMTSARHERELYGDNAFTAQNDVTAPRKDTGLSDATPIISNETNHGRSPLDFSHLYEEA